MRRVQFVSVAVVVALLPVLSVSAAHAVSADLATSFGDRGLVRLDLGHDSVDVAHALDMGAGVVAGSADGNMAVARLGGINARPGFGNEGRVTAEFGAPSEAFAVDHADSSVFAVGSAGDDFAFATFDENDGNPQLKVTTSFGAPAVARGWNQDTRLAAGEAHLGQGTSVALARYLWNGEPDLDFGTGGKLVDDVTSGSDVANAVAYGSAPGDPPGYVIAGRAGGQLLIARYLRDGQPDVAFGDAGRVLADLTAGDDVANALQLRPDGRIIVAGAAGGNGFLAMFTKDGIPDDTFGSAGVVMIDAGGASSLNSVSLVPGDFDLWSAAGTVVASSGTDAIVIRRHLDGSPDVTLGGSGQVVVDFGGDGDSVGAMSFDRSRGAPGEPDPVVIAGGDGNDMVTAELDGQGRLQGVAVGAPIVKTDFGRPSHETGGLVAAQPDGRIVVAGTGGSGFVLGRLLPDGEVDGTFNGGRLDVPTMGRLRPTDLALQPDGKILVAANRGANQRYVVRFLSSGAPDTAFASDGKAYVNGEKLALQPDGKILVLGGPRLLATGIPDPDYPSTRPSSEKPFGLLALPDNKALVSDAWPQEGGSIYQFHADGTTDSSVGNFGTGGNIGKPVDIARMADGRFVVVGTVGDRTNDSFPPRVGGPPGRNYLAVSSFKANGAMDASFGVGGTTIVTTAATEFAVGVAVQGDGKIVVAAYAADDLDGVSYSEILRFLPDGRLDISFGVGGVVQTRHMYPEAVTLAPDGDVLVAGHSWNGVDTDLAVARYSTSGVATRVPKAAGWNGVGQLGDRTTVDHHALQPVSGLAGATQVAAGAHHSLAVAGDGTVRAWGWNPFGQLGDATTTDRAAPVTVQGLDHVKSVSAGAFHSLAVRDDGTVWAWGYNGMGQLGDGSTVPRARPVRVAGLDRVTAVAAGAYHSLALKSDGTVWAWGYNGMGQLGDGSTTDRRLPIPLWEVQRGASAVAAGTFHSLAVTNDGNVQTWGWNGYGQLGRDSIFGTTQPRTVDGLTRVVNVAGGYLHSVALKTDGTVWSWGWNGVGQLGNGSTADSRTPVAATGLSGVVSIAVGFHHTVALKPNGGVVAWGWNAYGQLGTGTTLDGHTPVAVPGPVGSTGVISVAAGAVHTLSA